MERHHPQSDIKFVGNLKDDSPIIVLHKFDSKNIENNGEYQFYNSIIKGINGLIYEFSLIKSPRYLVEVIPGRGWNKYRNILLVEKAASKNGGS